jgi:hypothetical protein
MLCIISAKSRLELRLNIRFYIRYFAPVSMDNQLQMLRDITKSFPISSCPSCAAYLLCNHPIQTKPKAENWCLLELFHHALSPNLKL